MVIATFGVGFEFVAMLEEGRFDNVSEFYSAGSWVFELVGFFGKTVVVVVKVRIVVVQDRPFWLFPVS